MSISKTQNPILVIATLGVYLGLTLAAATPQVRAQSASADEIQINQRPVTDFLLNVRYQLESREINLESKFSAEYRTVIEKNGTLDSKGLLLTKSSGESKLKEMATRGIFAFADSGYFGYLRNLGVDSSVISVSYDGENFSARIISDMGKAEKARSVKSALSALIQIGKTQVTAENDRLILDSTSVSAAETNSIITLSLTRASLEQLIWEMGR